MECRFTVEQEEVELGRCSLLGGCKVGGAVGVAVGGPRGSLFSCLLIKLIFADGEETVLRQRQPVLRRPQCWRRVSGRLMVVLNIGHLFCYTGTVYITAWWMDAAGDPAGVAAAERGLHPRRPLRARGQHQVQARGLPRPRPRAQQRTEPPQCRGQDRPRRGQRHSGAASSLAHTGLGPRPQAPGQLWKQQPAGCMC